ncbi:WxL domain-containing protein [Vagococcus sp. BWB3-3]|uniref:WxL domain-containing protein n=1 Tax=Vagococcus allomyrinae TaxID=2794353 RepID=A0A940PB53_9ENTE|nr:WxL domain-containing protein [Vagococcus allomyrinae]MBP1039458.1 WxL domain-containing protein [Vagococcus allomyrinae]
MKKVTFLTITALLTLGVATPAMAATPKNSDADITLIEDDHPDGPLRISKVTDITFGIDSISGSDKSYYAHYLENDKNADNKYRANYMQVVDNRGTNQGWSLQVQNDAFKGKNDKGEDVTLANAELVMTSTHAQKNSVDKDTQAILPNAEVPVEATGWIFQSEVKVNGSAATIATAKKDNGMGVNNVYFGQASDVPSDNKKLETKNRSIELRIPGISTKSKTKYTSTLTWTLTDDPA